MSPLALPTMDFVAASLVRPGRREASPDEVLHDCQVWATALSFAYGPTVRRPWPFLDHWIWLPLANDAEQTAATGRYFLHAGTARIWDIWGSKWCGWQWVREKNTPRVSCLWRAPHVSWSQLGQIVATTADPPSVPPGVAWNLSLHPDHARLLQDYEELHGPGTGCFDVYSLRWGRRGAPPKEPIGHPFVPRLQYSIDPRNAPGHTGGE